MPERFLVQILRSLVTRGLLQSTCGVAGGYTLARPANQISLRDIIEAFDDPMEVKMPTLDCMSPDVRSRILETLQRVGDAAREELQKLTVADLLHLGVKPLSRIRIESEPPTEITFPLVESSDYDTSAGDSAAIR